MAFRLLVCLAITISLSNIAVPYNKAARGSISRRIGGTSTPLPYTVAFTGVVTRPFKFAVGQSLIYNKVLLNVGNGYNVRSGHFVAPVSGIYSVSVSLMGFHTNGIHVQLVKDGNVLVCLFTNKNTHELAAQTITIQLYKNETVWVRLSSSFGGNLYWTEPYNTFSVALISRGVS